MHRFASILLILFVAMSVPVKAETFALDLAYDYSPLEPFWVEEQGVVAEARLFPTRLLAATQDVLADNDRMLLPEGAQLWPLRGDLRVYCNLEKTEDRAYRSGRKRVCVVDEDADGVFDTYFERGVNGPRSIALYADIKTNRKPVRAFTFEELQPSDAKNAPYASLHYQRFVDSGNWFQATLDAAAGNAQPDGSFIRFHVKIGRESEGDRYWLAPGCGPINPARTQLFCTSGALPSELVFWGMRLRILERRDEALKFQILSGFDPAGFRGK